jgi:hypothetical protein
MMAFLAAKAKVQFYAFSWFFCSFNAVFTPSILAQKSQLFDIVFNVQFDFIAYNNHKMIYNK